MCPSCDNAHLNDVLIFKRLVKNSWCINHLIPPVLVVSMTYKE
uniref:Nucleolar GTP-binding protein 1 n=1 Tax=Rhizophora mucronata TaxID=61149 RepID=A0A2P2QDG5_RHIMU